MYKTFSIRGASISDGKLKSSSSVVVLKKGHGQKNLHGRGFIARILFVLKNFSKCMVFKKFSALKLVSAIFHYFFIFSPNDSPLKTMKNIFISSEKLFLFSRYSNFCIFSLHFHALQIQKDKWKWNDL